MDIDAALLMSPARAVVPTHHEVIALAAKLLARGNATDARKLLEDAINILDRTPALAAAAAFYTMRDPALPLYQRLVRVLALLAAEAEIPDWARSVRIGALRYLAEESQLADDWENAYSDSYEFLRDRCLEKADLLEHCHIYHSLIVSYQRSRATPWRDRRLDEIRIQKEVYLSRLRCIAENEGTEVECAESASSILIHAYLGDWDRTRAALKQSKSSLPKPQASILLHKLLSLVEASPLSGSDLVSSREVLSSVAQILAPEDPFAYIAKVEEARSYPKVGLALSGGGFRAAFFHLGTLAALAEHDILRHVSVISTVSGGSIVGTVYYLALRKMLAEKSDDQISNQDYVDLVQTTISCFSKAVAKNIRMRAFGDYRHALTGIFKARFNRTRRAGELYDRLLFESFFQKADRPSVSDLGFTQEGLPVRDFDRFNLSRTAKLPELVINTTSLRDGDLFSFAAHWAGQRMGSNRIDDERLLRSIPLGLAVAASACVPGLFDAVSIERTLPEEIWRRLIDWFERDPAAELDDILSRIPKTPERERIATALLNAKHRRESEDLRPIISNYSNELVVIKRSRQSRNQGASL